MSLKDLYRWTWFENTSVRFLGNVIFCHYGATRKSLLIGLRNLALADRVGSGNSIDTVSIDGRIVGMSELAKHV